MRSHNSTVPNILSRIRLLDFGIIDEGVEMHEKVEREGTDY